MVIVPKKIVMTSSFTCTRKRSIDAIDKKAHAEIDLANDLVEHETVPVDIDMVVDWFVGLVRNPVDTSLGNSLGKQSALGKVVLVSDV